MTREQAIEYGKSQLEVFGGEHREFIELAIKALEQEYVIDKIRTEIRANSIYVMPQHGRTIREADVLHIIDKYMTGGEGE